MSRSENAPGCRSPGWSRGNALIEFVLVLPFFLMLVLGAIDWGWYFVVREIAVNATRQGARVGSVAPSEAAAREDALNAVETYLFASLGRSEVEGLDANVSNCGSPAYRCVTVSLTAFPAVADRPASSLSGLIAWTRVPPTISARTEMRLEIQP